MSQRQTPQSNTRQQSVMDVIKNLQKSQPDPRSASPAARPDRPPAAKRGCLELSSPGSGSGSGSPTSPRGEASRDRPRSADGAGRADSADLRTIVREAVREELVVITTELRKDFDALSRSLSETMTALGQRIRQIECSLSDKDAEIGRLRDELRECSGSAAAMEDSLDAAEAEFRQSTLILSGEAVPAPQRDSNGREDVTSVAVSVISAALPSVGVTESDIAGCFRVGDNRKIVCKFLRTGMGSVRDKVFEGRFELMKQRDQRRRLFVAESLTRRRQAVFAALLEAKRKKQIYTVFTRNGAVFFRERQHEQAHRVDHPSKLACLPK